MKIFHKHFYGDGEEQPLPATRRQAFSYYGKENFGKLIALSALCALFFLPSLAWLFVMNYNKTLYVNALDKTAANYAAALNEYLKSFVLTTYGVLVPLLALFFVGLAGCFYCARKMCFAQNAKIKDFFRGIKENGLAFALYGAIFGSAYFTLKFNLVYFSDKHPAVFGLFIGGAVVLLLLVGIILTYCMTQSVTYDVTVKQKIKNALILTFAKFLPNTGIAIAAAAPFLLTALIPSPFQLLGLLVLTLFYIGFAALLVTCYADSVFDRTINPRLGDEYVGRGLSKRQEKQPEQTSEQ